MNIDDILIDPEFAALIPPLSEDERQILERNIHRDGFRDPVVIWQNHSILLDGHNRVELWQRLFRDDPIKCPDVVEVKLPDRDAAKEWIIRHQLGRRNVTDAVRAELALLLKPTLKKQADTRKVESGKATGRGKVSVNLPEPIKPIDVREEIASIAGVSGRTVDKVEAVLRDGDEETKAKMRSNELSIDAAYKTVKAAKGGTKSSEVTPPKLKPTKVSAIKLAHDAINFIRTIPKSDPERAEGLELVQRFIQQGGESAEPDCLGVISLTWAVPLSDPRRAEKLRFIHGAATCSPGNSTLRNRDACGMSPDMIETRKPTEDFPQWRIDLCRSVFRLAQVICADEYDKESAEMFLKGVTTAMAVGAEVT